MPNSAKKICWVVTDGKAGMENQCLGLAEALQLSPIVKRIALNQPWRALVPWLRCGLKYAFSKNSSRIEKPWPDILIASGRLSTAASLLVKKQHPQTMTIQIQSPGIASHHFDLLVVPRHDKIERFITRNNVIKTKGALHRVTTAFLHKESTKYLSLTKNLSGLRIAVLIGGPNKSYQFTADIAEQLSNQLLALQKNQQVSLLVTASRRTGKENITLLQEKFADKDNIIFQDPFDHGPNPYYGFLGLCDAIIVTSDSVSMISEACATGKPVHIFHLPGGSPKFDRFHAGLLNDGITRNFQGKVESWEYTPLNEMDTVTEKIKTLIFS